MTQQTAPDETVERPMRKLLATIGLCLAILLAPVWWPLIGLLKAFEGGRR